MSAYGGPNIVEDGLVLCLDAANKKSYSGSGTVWRDLSGFNRDATIVGTSTWNSRFGGRFDFGDIAQTNQYIVLPHQVLQSLQDAYTMEFWLSPAETFTTPKYFCSAATSANNNYYIVEISSNTIRRYTGSTSFSYIPNQVMQFCMVRNGSNTGFIYKDGIEKKVSTEITTVNQVENGGWILNQEQDSVGGGFDPAQNYRGSFMALRVYNKALNDVEILNNYNALKGRFQLT